VERVGGPLGTAWTRRPSVCPNDLSGSTCASGERHLGPWSIWPPLAWSPARKHLPNPVRVSGGWPAAVGTDASLEDVIVGAQRCPTSACAGLAFGPPGPQLLLQPICLLDGRSGGEAPACGRYAREDPGHHVLSSQPPFGIKINQPESPCAKTQGKTAIVVPRGGVERGWPTRCGLASGGPHRDRVTYPTGVSVWVCPVTTTIQSTSFEKCLRASEGAPQAPPACPGPRFPAPKDRGETPLPLLNYRRAFLRLRPGPGLPASTRACVFSPVHAAPKNRAGHREISCATQPHNDRCVRFGQLPAWCLRGAAGFRQPSGSICFSSWRKPDPETCVGRGARPSVPAGDLRVRRPALMSKTLPSIAGFFFRLRPGGHILLLRSARPPAM